MRKKQKINKKKQNQRAYKGFISLVNGTKPSLMSFRI